ncbi:spindle pole body [Apiospora arundinis]|uniref:Spindle pole body component alp14 n=1 Tax=Apiospora arundinis TaxID=335852 RepID=A0ABR2IJ34_9PEZI
MPFDHLRRPSLHKLIQKVADSVSSPPKSAHHGTKSSRDFTSLFKSNKKQQQDLQSPPPTPSTVTSQGATTPRSPLAQNSYRPPPVQPPDTPPNEMAEGEPDYSSLPLTDRWVHKQWKVRKEAYEEAAKAFEITPDEYDPAFRPFNQDPSLWKGAVADSNVAAQTDGTAAYVAFLKFGGKENSVRSRGHTVGPICEKGLVSTRPATKASCAEALLLLIELDVAAPVVEEILPALSAKQPKVIAAALAALTTIYHNYGCKTVDPKPVLKILPKAFGHADKNVRAEATNLAVEFYRWLREAMKPMFWNDLKPTQQTDLEGQFEKIKEEGPAKQERFLRSQQAAMARAPPPGAAGEDEYAEDDGADEPAEVDAFDLAEPQDVLSKVPANFHDNLASSKWKERKEALEALFAIINVPRIKDGHFDEINRGLAKSMKDANIAVVVQAAQCIEVLAKGLRKSYGKYRSIVQAPIMERLKEKKAAVSDALGAALDQVFLATSFSECFEETLGFLVHKNPQVKEGTLKFIVRCLRTTRDVPNKQEITSLVEAAKKLLAEGSEGLRSGGAEILGTIMKIVGERAMNPHLEGLDDIRKTKIKEYFETAEVKAKEKPKPKPAAPAARAPPAGAKKMVKKVPPGTKKPAGSAPLAAQPTPRAAPAAAKPALAKPSGLTGLKAPQKRIGAPAGLASPRRVAAPPPPEEYYEEEEEDEVLPASPPPRPRVGVGRGGLAGRSLAKPAAPAAAPAAPTSPTPSSGLTAMERAELEEIRATNYRLLKQADDMRHERSKMNSEIQELKNQNAQLIEDHTRDVLSIKAKETQLVRARSDAEAAEQNNERLKRELERLKRALSKAEALQSRGGSGSPALGSPTDDAGIYRDNPPNPAGGRFDRMSFTSNQSEEKENGEAPHQQARKKMMSPELRVGSGSSGRGSPARGFRSTPIDEHTGNGYQPPPPQQQAAANPNAAGGPGGNGVESWKRAAEVTSQLKARIEQMKARQGFNRP